MRPYMQFDDHDKRALRALDDDLTINVLNEGATVAGEMRVEIIRPASAGGDQFQLRFKLPGGEEFDVNIGRAQLLERMMSKSKPEPVPEMQRRHEFCERFAAERHPRVDACRMVPLDGPDYIRDGDDHIFADWWLHTEDCLWALGFVWLAHLFDRHQLFDHAWMIGRSNQSPGLWSASPIRMLRQPPSRSCAASWSR